MKPRVNDRVCVWNNMTRVGVVKEVFAKSGGEWYVGGSPGRSLYARITFPDREEVVETAELKVVERP